MAQFSIHTWVGRSKTAAFAAHLVPVATLNSIMINGESLSDSSLSFDGFSARFGALCFIAD